MVESSANRATISSSGAFKSADLRFFRADDMLPPGFECGDFSRIQLEAQSMTKEHEPQQNEKQRKPYKAPTTVFLGHVRDLTFGSGRSPGDRGGLPKNMM